MSDMSPEAAPPAGADQQPVLPMRFLGQFIKDLSFEAPNAPEVFNALRQQAPAITVGLDTDVRQIEGPVFEVTLSVHLEAKAADKTAFILELVYGSIAEINKDAVPEEYVHSLLLIEVPRHMFPFVRQIIADLTGNAGFPPLMVQMVDFADMYRKKFAAAAAAAAAQNETPPPAVH